MIALIAMLLATGAEAGEGATLWGFNGTAILNSVSDSKSNAWGIYQETPTKYGIWDLGYLNEGDQQTCVAQTLKVCFGDKRDGMFALYEIPWKLSKNLQTSFALGPYFSATTVTEPNGIDYHDAYRTDLLTKASVTYVFNDRWKTSLDWWRVMYSTNDFVQDGMPARGDSDVFSISIGRSF